MSRIEAGVTPEDFARTQRRAWRLGFLPCDTSALLLVSMV